MFRAGLIFVLLLTLVVTTAAAPLTPVCGGGLSAYYTAQPECAITTWDDVMEDHDDLEGFFAREYEALERRSFFSKIGHAVSHAAHSVAHAVTHPVQTVVHAVTHPITTLVHAAKTVAHVVAHPVSSIKHVVSTIHHTIKHVASTIHHAVKTVAHGVKSAVHFIKTNGPTIAKIGLKMLASSQGILSTVSKFVPGVGIPLSKALKVEAKGLDMASGMIHANVPHGWQTAMNVMSFAEDPVGNGLKKAGLHGAVGAAASVILG